MNDVVQGVAARVFPTPITKLKGVGPRLAERLANLNLHSVEDLLFHLPFRYEDRTRLVPIGTLRPGDHAVIQGNVELNQIKFGKRRMLLVHVSDGSGMLLLRFFHFNAQQQQLLARGVSVRCFGEIRRGQKSIEMIHPEYRVITEPAQIPQVDEHLTPVYPTTEQLHQLSMRQLTQQALQWLNEGRLQLQECLPQAVLQEMQFVDLVSALVYLHRPPPDVSHELLETRRHPMQLRLAFEELLAQAVSLRQRRLRAHRDQARGLNVAGDYSGQLLAQLPFVLTAAQQRVWQEIRVDLARAEPMQRLVQGDVGSGKTIVAVLAALQAIEAGYQVAMMAPTELLAEQHYQNVLRWLAPLSISIAWLSGKLKGKARQQTCAEIAQGQVQLVVGTHALFQDDVEFATLALVIIDEQHRFGVHQRLALREKGVRDQLHPHQLIMTATPIPRTLAMTIYADLDVSVIDELPPGRKPVETVAIPDARRAQVVQRVAQACRQGRQIYWVCSLIEESEVLQCQAAEDTAGQLTEALPQVRVGLLHGRLSNEIKERVMQQFKSHAIDLLVATTVVEVGVDVPNASLMIIENAERFGLAQLHQLRGRVGRGSHDSVCVLLYHGNLSTLARARIKAMRETNDGFEIARRDLEIRGPGEMLGIKQTGMMQLRVADLRQHQALLPAVNRWADKLLRESPQLAEGLVQRWIGAGTRFADV
ncbi:MAG: ATP-dependent DNA helicase RecG [Gammaproteobacteria bacterium]|nr:ATP-dependent DNA helicase RecG [Gammaproteobacteria bacterium]